MKKFLLIIITTLIFVSCVSSPSSERSEPVGDPITLDTVRINIQENTPSNGREIKVEVLFFPENKMYALRFPYQDYINVQYLNTEFTEMLIQSFARFTDDQNKGTLKEGLKSLRAYGMITGIALYEYPRYYGSFKSRPVFEFGYLYNNNQAFFSVVQEEADIEGIPDNAMNGMFKSVRLPVFFSNEEVQKLVDILSLDPSPVVCFGDNVTSGYAATRKGIADRERSYPAYLQEKIKVPVVNAGGGWETTEKALQRLDQDVLSYDPQIVIVFLGANDFAQRVPLAEIQQNLEEMISRLNNGKRDIFIVKFYSDTERLYSIMWDWKISNEEKRDNVNEMEKMYAELSRLDGCTIITDAWQGVWGENMSTDYNNPVAAGNEIMADNILNDLRPVLIKRHILK